MKNRQITDTIEKFAPLQLAEPWDNPGLMMGNLDDECRGVIVALDLTKDVVRQAIEQGCNLIVTHHPFFFSAIKCIDTSVSKGGIIEDVLKNGLTVYSAHTNLDECEGGLCMSLATLLGGENLAPNGVGVVCDVKVQSLEKFAKHVANTLKDDSVKYTGKGSKTIEKAMIICGGGASDDAYENAKANADVFVSGDFKHHLYVASENDDFPIVEFSHYSSEIIVQNLFEQIIAPTGVSIIKAKQNRPFKTVGGYNEI